MKQHLRTIKVLYDLLIVAQVLPANPATGGPKLVAKKGKRPILDDEQARGLLASIDDSHGRPIHFDEKRTLAVLTKQAPRPRPTSPAAAAESGDHRKRESGRETRAKPGVRRG